MSINGLITTKLKSIKTENGLVLHGIRSIDKHYDGFGEAYFSIIKGNAINAWKMHQLVPAGIVRFNFIDARKDSLTYMNRVEITVSQDNYRGITVPPNIIFGFRGLSTNDNIVTNIASMAHQDTECLKIDFNEYEFI